MNILESLRDLFRHMEWADAVVWQAVLSSPEASADKNIKGRLFHTHRVQRAFLKVWRAEPLVQSAGSDLGLKELARWGREYHALIPGFTGSVTEADLDQPRPMPWAREMSEWLGREVAVTSLGETMLQVASHSTYHRGQINTRLRELGAEPPLTDFIVWLWFGRPAAEWPVDDK